MNRARLALVGAVVLAAACESSTSPEPGNQPASVIADQAPIGVLPLRALLAPGQDVSSDRAGSGGKTSTGIFYHGGPILPTPKVVAVYWSGSTIYSGGPAAGTTGSGAQDGSLVGFFMRSLGGSPYWNINSTYTNSSGQNVANSLAYAGYWANNSSVPAAGASVSDAQMQAMLNSGFTSGKIAYDPQAVYAIFTGHGVNLGGGFGSQYCAYHTYYTSSAAGGIVKYAAQPYNADFYSGCSSGFASTNGDRPADVEVNTLAHELEEAATDPQLNAWYDRRGYENADKCAWTWGTTYTTGNGGTANMNIGGKDFLIQRNWVNAGRGGCLTAYP
jgi:phosphate-induced protein 1